MQAQKTDYEDPAIRETGPRILLIEDSAVDARILRSAFEGGDAHVTTAATLADGRERLRTADFDLVFVDLLLPDSHGLEKIAEIQSLAPQTPIVVITGLEDEVLARRALQLGADDFLLKSERSSAQITRSARQALDRAQARKDILRNERWMRALCDASRDGILVEHGEVIVFANRACTELFGYESVSEILGRRVNVLCASHEEARILNYGRLRASGQSAPKTYEFQGLCRNGNPVELEASVSKFELCGKHYIISVIRNVEERKRAEHSLRLAEFALNQAPDAVTWLDSEGRYTYANLAFSRILGYSPQEAQEKLVFDVDPSLTRAAWTTSWQRLRQGCEETIRAELVTKDGTMVPVEIRTALIAREGKEYCVALSRDIRERLRAEDALRELAEQNKALYESERSARLLQDAVTEANLALTESLDLDQCLARLLNLLQTLIPCDGAAVMLSSDGQTFSVAAAQGYGELGETHLKDVRFRVDSNVLLQRMVHSRKSLLVADTTACPEWQRVPGAEQVRSWLGVPLIAQGKLIGVYSLDKNRPGFFNEDYERLAQAVAAPAALAIHNALLHKAALESEERYRDLFENANDWILMTDSQMRLTSLNRAALTQLGKKAEEMLGCPLEDYVAPESRPAFRRIFEKVRATGTPAAAEIETVSRSGKKRLLDVNFRLIRTESGPDTIQCLGRDVTARKRLEESLRQAKQMEAIGRLAGGVAHDFNNLLMIIRGYAEMLQEELPKEESPRKNIEEILTATARATDLTRQLLTVGRRQVRRLELVDLNAAVAKLRESMEGVFPPNIEWVVRVLAKPLPVRMDRDHLDRLLLNLTVNAKDAMPSGGVFRVELQRVTTEKLEALPPELLNSGPFALLTVRDTGSGIAADTLPLIFEPFFTTKERGKGTGLGLATVYAIVKQAGGHVVAESSPGEGAKFKVWLPLVEAAAESVTMNAQESTESEVPRGTETVLIVEDQAPLRRLTESLLKELGYRVLSAAEGTEALEVAASFAARIDVLLTDVIMPGMNGREVAEALCAQRPEIKVLYMSGYSDEILARKGGLLPGIQLLEKPFTRQGLAKKLRRVIQGEANRS